MGSKLRSSCSTTILLKNCVKRSLWDIFVFDSLLSHPTKMVGTFSSSHGSEKVAHTVGDTSRPSSIMSNNQQPEKKFSLDWRGRVVLFTLCILTLMAALDGTSLSVALPVSIHFIFTQMSISNRLKTISQELHGSAIEAFWSGTAFLLSSTGTTYPSS